MSELDKEFEEAIEQTEPLPPKPVGEEDYKLMDINFAVDKPMEQIISKPKFNCAFNTLDYPAIAMSLPFFLSNEVPNNTWMEEIVKEKGEEYKIDLEQAKYQFLELYNILNTSSLVHLVPAKEGLQDLVYTANLGFVMPHHIAKNTFIISNFRSQPRVGEAQVGKDFFEMMGFNIIQSPHFFEGYADLKPLYGDILIGGYGIRTDKRAYEWMEKEFGVRIIKVKMETPELYHFDCNFFNLDGENAFVCCDLMYDEDVAEIEKYINIIDIPEDDAFSGTTNSVRVGNLIINASSIQNMKKTDKYYELEKKRVEKVAEDIVSVGLEPVFVDLGTYQDSGALTSCLVLPLNYSDYMLDYNHGEDEEEEEVKNIKE